MVKKIRYWKGQKVARYSNSNGFYDEKLSRILGKPPRFRYSRKFLDKVYGKKSRKMTSWDDWRDLRKIGELLPKYDKQGNLIGYSTPGGLVYRDYNDFAQR